MVQLDNTTDKNYTVLNAYVNEIIQFVQIYNEDLNRLRDYGNGELIKPVEVYTLHLIERNPGITVSGLAQKQRRTKGTVSANVTSLEKKGYVYREKRSNNAKIVHIYCTAAGEKLSTLYSAFTAKKTRSDQDRLLKMCSQEDINVFCRVLHQYLKIMTDTKNQ